MNNAAALDLAAMSAPWSQSTARTISPVAVAPRSADQEMEHLARALSLDFPLHRPGELRRALREAADEVWPRKDSTDILDEARRRLQEGMFS